MSGYMTLAMSRNGYSYVHGNPINLTDPSGELAPLVIIGLSAILSGGYEYGHQVYSNWSNGCGSKSVYKNIDWMRVFKAGGEEGIVTGISLLLTGGLVPVGTKGLLRWLLEEGIETGVGLLWDLGVRRDSPEDALLNAASGLLFSGALTVGGRGARTLRKNANDIGDGSNLRVKRGPKPKRQGPHNRTIQKRIDELQDELGPEWEHTGGGQLKEKVVPTPGGKKSKRRPDITFQNTQTGEKYYEQVGKTLKTGEPVSREVDALDDLEKVNGKRPRFTPYDR